MSDDDFDNLLDDFEEKKPKPKSKKKNVAPKKKEKPTPTPEDEDEIDLEFVGDEDETPSADEVEYEKGDDEELEGEIKEFDFDSEDDNSVSELQEEEESELNDIGSIDLTIDDDVEDEDEEDDIEIDTDEVLAVNGEKESNEDDEEFFIDTSQEGQYDKDFEKDYDEKPKKAKQVKIIVFHGRKGKGKTAASMSVLYALKGKNAKKKKALILELDKKAKSIKNNLYKNDPRLIIEDVSKYMKFRPAAVYLEACDKTIQYMFFILNKYKDRKDIGVVIIDGLEVFLRGTEGRIRHIGNRPLTGGISWEYWNIRLLDIQELLNSSRNLTSKYVVFNTKTRTETVEIDDKEVQIEVIKWHSVIEEETDNVFKCSTIRDAEGEIHFMIQAETCKEEIQTGAYLDVTGEKAYPKFLKEAPLEKTELK